MYVLCGGYGSLLWMKRQRMRCCSNSAIYPPGRFDNRNTYTSSPLPIVDTFDWGDMEMFLYCHTKGIFTACHHTGDILQCIWKYILAHPLHDQLVLGTGVLYTPSLILLYQWSRRNSSMPGLQCPYLLFILHQFSFRVQLSVWLFKRVALCRH